MEWDIVNYIFSNAAQLSMKVSKVLLLGLCLVYMSLPIGLSSNDAYVTAILKDAQEKFGNGSFQQALNLFNNAKNLDPDQIDAWYGVAESNYYIENYKECDELCDKALRDRPFEETSGLDRFAELAATCTIAYKEKTGNDLVNVLEPGKAPESYQQAREYYYLAISLNSNSTSAWNSLGMLEAKQYSNYTGSIYCFDRALEINSSLAAVWNNKGVSLAILERYNEALECFDNATKLNPNLAEAWNNKVKPLGRLKDDALDKGEALNPDLASKRELNWFWVNSS